MKIAILSRKRTLYSTRRLVEAARARGHEPRVMDPLNFDLRIAAGQGDLFYGKRRVRSVDGVIPRIGQSITVYGLAVLRQFEMTGVPTVNDSQAIARSRDKLRALQLLCRHGVGLPDTVVSRHPEHVGYAMEMVGGAPVIIKLVQGTQGVGVMRADSPAAAESLIQTLHELNQNLLIQQYVAESKGRDVRALVVGRKVLAAMTRTADGDEEFRSNLARGGIGEAVKLDRHYRQTAITAAAVMGLGLAGVDMLITKDGPKVLEVNSSPGLEGIEAATGVDVADRVVEHLERLVGRRHRRVLVAAGVNGHEG